MKYKIGDKVLYTTKNKSGTIIDSFKTEDGNRYYVRINGNIWSIPERCLK